MNQLNRKKDQIPKVQDTQSLNMRNGLAWLSAACAFSFAGCAGNADPSTMRDFDGTGLVPSLRVLRGEMPDGYSVKPGAVGSYQMDFKVGDRFRTTRPATITRTKDGDMELVFVRDLDLLQPGYRVIENVPSNTAVVLVAIKADRKVHFGTYLQIAGQAQWLRCRTFCRSSTFEDPGKMVVSRTRFERL
jgi:hypothetical protein